MILRRGPDASPALAAAALAAVALGACGEQPSTSPRAPQGAVRGYVVEMGSRRGVHLEPSAVEFHGVRRRAGRALARAELPALHAGVWFSLRRRGGRWRVVHSDLRTAQVKVPNASMTPALAPGRRVTVGFHAYDRRRPRRGDVVLFRAPGGAGENRCARPRPRTPCAQATRDTSSVRMIKRVVAVGGDRLALRRGRVVLNGRRPAEPYVSGACRPVRACDLPRAITVPRGTVYVLGDARGRSDDSRFWGPVAVRQVLGRVAGA
jgi:signal peptidase I